ncbi:MAG: ECF transporter S component, partial [Oscillospiraceae bacterium]
MQNFKFKKFVGEKWDQKNLTMSRKIALSGVFLAFGILFPQIFHLFSLTGPVFLPMHISVFVGAMILGPVYGGLLGFLTPVLSSVLTSMPSIAPIPMLPIMICELTLYGIISGLLYKFSKNIFISQYSAMIVGRLGYAGAFYCLINLFGYNLPPKISALGAVITGVPGIILQIIIIPILFVGVKKALLASNFTFNSYLHKNGFTLALLKNKKVIYSSFEKGIKPLFMLYKENSEMLKNSIVCDRVTGKAAACICIFCKVSEIRCDLISQHALDVLKKSDVKIIYKQCVPYIINRKKDGMCPMENLVL